MSIEFNYETETVHNINTYDLLQWIGELHSEMADAGLLPDGVSTETHQQLMIFVKAAETAQQTGNVPC